MFFSFFSPVCLLMFLKGHFFSSCHLSVLLMCICAGSAGRPAGDTVLPFPITWPPSLRTCAALRVHVCAPSRVIPQNSCRCVLCRPSTCLPWPDWLRCGWGILIGGQRMTPSESEWLSASVLFVFSWTQDEASARMCMSLKFLCSVMSLKGRRFSLDSYAWVQIFALWLTTEWTKSRK